MILKFKFQFIFFLVLLLGIVFFSSISVKAQSSITDPSEDVTKINQTQDPNGNTVITYQTVTDHADIDILSASYTNGPNGTASIKLTVRGSIELNNQTYYHVELTDNRSSSVLNIFHIDLYYTLADIANLTGAAPNTVYTYQNGSIQSGHQLIGYMSTYVVDHSLTWTLGTNISIENVNSSIVFPPFQDSWAWKIRTWQGTNASDYYGNQYDDFYPDSDNFYTTLSLASNSVPGFDFFTILIIPAVVVINIKIKKHQK